MCGKPQDFDQESPVQYINSTINPGDGFLTNLECAKMLPSTQLLWDLNRFVSRICVATEPISWYFISFRCSNLFFSHSGPNWARKVDKVLQRPWHRNGHDSTIGRVMPHVGANGFMVTGMRSGEGGNVEVNWNSRIFFPILRKALSF